MILVFCSFIIINFCTSLPEKHCFWIRKFHADFKSMQTQIFSGHMWPSLDKPPLCRKCSLYGTGPNMSTIVSGTISCWCCISYLLYQAYLHAKSQAQASLFSWDRSAHDRLSLWTEQEYREIHSSVYRCHRYRRFLAVGCGWGCLQWQREQGKLLEGRLARARRAVRTRSRLTKYTEQDYGNIVTTRFSYFTIATRNYWHALIFATVRTWKISKIPPKSARTDLPGHIKISILTKCGVRVAYPETVTYIHVSGGMKRWVSCVSTSKNIIL